MFLFKSPRGSYGFLSIFGNDFIPWRSLVLGDDLNTSTSRRILVCYCFSNASMSFQYVFWEGYGRGSVMPGLLYCTLPFSSHFSLTSTSAPMLFFLLLPFPPLFSPCFHFSCTTAALFSLTHSQFNFRTFRVLCPALTEIWGRCVFCTKETLTAFFPLTLQNPSETRAKARKMNKTPCGHKPDNWEECFSLLSTVKIFHALMTLQPLLED